MHLLIHTSLLLAALAAAITAQEVETVFASPTQAPEIITLTSTASPTTFVTRTTKTPSTNTLIPITTPTFTSSSSSTSSSPNKVVIIAASVGGTAVLAAALMGLYFCCCKRRKKRKNTKNPIRSDEFFAPSAPPMREPRIPILPPTPVNTGGHKSWPLGDGGMRTPPPVYKQPMGMGEGFQRAELWDGYGADGRRDTRRIELP